MDEDITNENNKVSREIKTPSKLLLAFKVLFFLFCLLGFLYQTSEFLEFYYTYPSVIELITETPNMIQLPALTYCYVNGITRNNFCGMFPEVCHYLSEGEEDCENFPLYCKHGIKVPLWRNVYNITNIFLDNFQNSEDQITDFLAETSWNASKEERAGPFFYATWWSLEIITCYTLYSRVDSNKDPFEMKFEYSGVPAPSLKNYVAWMDFDLQNKSMFDSETVEGIAIAVHSPFTAAYPDMKTLLKPGNRYEMELDIKEEHFLPFPFNTDCMNYTVLWENNNRTGPRSKKMCEDLCGVLVDEACYGCVEVWNLYPHSKKRCIKRLNRGNVEPCNSSLLQEFKDCKSRCKRECLTTKYNYSISKMRKDPWDSRGYPRGKIRMDIYMELDKLILKHSPKYQAVELFSNVGGYIGIWLGISLFAVTDLIENVIVTLKPYIQICRLKFGKPKQVHK